jgi:phosphoglycerate-specific signal transduction histidine kinase
MSSEEQKEMAKTRALLTETDRQYIKGSEGDDKRYQSTSRIRRRINEELPQDLDILAEHHPELLDELKEAVCEDPPVDFTFLPLGKKNISYGPSARDDAAFVLRVGTDEGTVKIHLNEDEMYELWTEVQHTPWPDTLDEQDEIGYLRQQLVDRAMGANAEMLRDALEALDPHWQER